MTPAAALLAIACLAIGCACGWLARSRWTMSRAAHDPAQPYMVTAVVKIPGLLFGEPIYGLGLEVSGLLVSDLKPDAPDDGTDPTTGLDPRIWGDGGQ